MSENIDNKVVQMQFDNAQFEKGVSQTSRSLDLLKKSLSFDGVDKGFDKISAASSGVSLDNLSESTKTIASRFTNMGIIGVTALQNITNKAVDAGLKITKALTIQPMISGYQEYETQMGAIQTIMANTGAPLKKVNKTLNELNRYADMTIYDFTQMTKNIGTFTAAGIKLKTSTKAIEGIANLAAVSGSNADQANTAMYQLSQALAAGSVKLQDWNSVVNAGMGGKVFQNALKRTATVMGTNVDAMIKKSGSFRESLKNGWITSKVLTRTLDQFTMSAKKGSKEYDKYMKTLSKEGYSKKQAQGIIKMANTAYDAATKVKTFTQLIDTLKEALGSGWTQTWQYVIGDFGEAKKMFTNINQVLSGFVNANANARNNVLKDWHDLGGRTDLLKGFTNMFSGLFSVLKPIHDAFANVFPSATGKQLANLSKSFEKITERMHVSKKTAADIRHTFEGLFRIFKNGVDIVEIGLVIMGKAIEVVTPIIGFFAKSIISLTGEIGKFVSKYVSIEKISKIIKNGLNALNPIFKKAIDAFEKASHMDLSNFYIDFSKIEPAIKKAGKALNDFFKSTKLGSQFTSFTSYIKKEAEDAFIGLSGALGKAAYSVSTFYKKVVNFSNIEKHFISLVKWIGNLISNFSLFDKAYAATAGKAEKASDKISKSFDKVESGKVKTSKVATALTAFGNTIEKAAVAVKNALASMWDGIKTFVSHINSKDVFAVLTGVVAGGYVMSIHNLVKSFKDLLKSKSEMFESIGNAAKGFGGVMGQATKTLKAFQNQIKAKVLLEIASSLILISIAMTIISKIDSDKLGGSLGAVAALYAILFGMMKAMQKGIDWKLLEVNLVSVGMAMIVMAISLDILASALNKIANAGKWDAVAKGIVGVGASAVILVGMMTLLTKVSKMNTKLGGKHGFDGMITAGLAMIVFAAALNVMARAVKSFSGLSWDELEKGLTGVAGCVLLLTVYTMAVPEGKVFAAATGMLALAGAILSLANAIKVYSAMKPEVFETGFVRIGIALGLLAGFVAASGMGKKVFSASVGMMALVTSLLMMYGVMKMYAALPFETLAKGLISLGIAIGILTIFVKSVSKGSETIKAASAMIVLATAVQLLALSIYTLGNMGIIQLVKGLVALAVVIGLLESALEMVSKFPEALPGAAAMFIVAAALGVLALAISVLASVPILGLVVALAALAGTLLIMSGILVGLSAIGPALLIVGAAFGLLGIGLILAAAAALLMVTALTALLPLILVLGKTNTDTINKGLNALLTIFLVLTAGTIALGAGLLILGAGAIVAGIGIGIMALALIAVGVGAALAAVGLTLLTGAIALIVTVIGLASGSVSATLKNVALNIELFFLDVFGFIIEHIPFLGKKLGPGIEKAKADIKGKLSKSEGKKIGKDFNDGIAEASNKNKSSTESVTKMATDMNKSFNAESGKIKKSGGELPGAIGANVTKNKGAATGSMKDLGSSMKSALNSSGGLNLKSTGSKASKSYASGISGEKKEVKSSASSLGSSAANAADKTKKWKGIGEDAADGYAKGIKNHEYKAINAAAGLATNAGKAAKDAQDSDSPSKLYEKFGKWCSQGYAMGITKLSSLASTAAANLGYGSMNSMSSAISSLSDKLNDNMDASPTIKPVMDLDDVQSGIKSINELVNNQNGVISLGSDVLNNKAAVAAQISQNGASGNQVISALGKLNLSIQRMQTGNSYSVAGISYSEGSNVADALKTIINAAVVKGRA